MIGQKKRLTASAARRKHSVTAAIFDCCTLICRIGEKLAVYPSQIPRVLQDIFEGRNVVVVPHGVYPVIHGDVAHAVPWEEVLDKLPGLQVIPP